MNLSWWTAMAGHTFKSSKGTLGNESTCSLQPSAAPKAKMFYDSVTNVWLHASTIISSDNETGCFLRQMRMICTELTHRGCRTVKMHCLMIHDNIGTCLKIEKYWLWGAAPSRYEPWDVTPFTWLHSGTGRDGARGPQRPYHRHVHGVTEVNSLHDAIHCLRSPTLSAPADSTTRCLRNYFQPSKLSSQVATAATLIDGAGAHADGSFLWGQACHHWRFNSRSTRNWIWQKIVVKGMCSRNCHFSSCSYQMEYNTGETGNFSVICC